MPAKKIVSDKYTIKAPDVIIDGNLIVGGTRTESSIQNTDIQDKTIVLNKGEIGPGITGAEKFSGIEIDRGPAPSRPVGLRFNEDPEGDGSVGPSWQATEDGTTWKYLLQGSSSSGLTEVAEDLSPTLGGNLEVNGNTITDTVSNVEIIFDTVSGGGSGVFVTNDNFDQNNKQELVIKRKAFIYALIF